MAVNAIVTYIDKKLSLKTSDELRIRPVYNSEEARSIPFRACAPSSVIAGIGTLWFLRRELERIAPA